MAGDTRLERLDAAVCSSAHAAWRAAIVIATTAHPRRRQPDDRLDHGNHLSVGSGRSAARRVEPV